MLSQTDHWIQKINNRFYVYFLIMLDQWLFSWRTDRLLTVAANATALTGSSTLSGSALMAAVMHLVGVRTVATMGSTDLLGTSDTTALNATAFASGTARNVAGTAVLSNRKSPEKLRASTGLTGGGNLLNTQATSNTAKLWDSLSRQMANSVVATVMHRVRSAAMNTTSLSRHFEDISNQNLLEIANEEVYYIAHIFQNIKIIRK
jgi:hypothetical protein